MAIKIMFTKVLFILRKKSFKMRRDGTRRNGCKPNIIMYPITYPFVFKDAYTISTIKLVQIDSLHMLEWLMLHFPKNIAWKQKNPAYPVTKIPYSRSSIMMVNIQSVQISRRGLVITKPGMFPRCLFAFSPAFPS